jgi:hypothetical protein
MSEGSALPPVDPDYLITEYDTNKLRLYARGLLQQLRGPLRTYSFEKVKAAAVWLVGAYVEAQIPLAPEMDALIAGVVNWQRRASTWRKVQQHNEEAYWKAILFEANHRPILTISTHRRRHCIRWRSTC